MTEPDHSDGRGGAHRPYEIDDALRNNKSLRECSIVHGVAFVRRRRSLEIEGFEYVVVYPRTENPRVGGSIPPLATISHQWLPLLGEFHG